MFSHGTCTFEILSSYQFSPLLLHVSKDEKFCFWIPDVLKENFCLKFSWCLILLSWHLCPMLVVGWNFLMDLFHFRLFSENLLKYLAYSVSPPSPPPNDVLFVKALSWKMKLLSIDWTFSDYFKHIWILAQKPVCSISQISMQLAVGFFAGGREEC